MFQPADEDDLSAFLKCCPKDIPVLPVGIGSNLLVRDGGIPGRGHPAVGQGLRPKSNRSADTRLAAGAAVPDKHLAAAGARRPGSAGFISITAFPAVIGGALRMNAGAMAR
jgi:UDP-N-acetylmuramate dehydrogenase